MIDWIIEQIWPLSFTISAILLLNYFLKTYLSAKLHYYLWLLVPLVLIINNIPSASSMAVDTQLHSYVVTIATQSKSLDMFGILSVIWFFGFILLSLVVAYEHYKILSSFNRDKSFTHKLNGKLPVYICNDISSPVLFGLIKQHLFIPNDFYTRYDKEQIELIYQHEWVHFKRKDNWSNACAIFLLTIFWFNPLCWLGYSQYRKQQEIACDADVLKQSDKKKRITYCKALISSISHNNNRLSSYSYYMEKSTMKQRIQHIQIMSKGNIVVTMLAALVLLGGLSSMAFAKYEQNVELNMIDKQSVNPLMRVNPVYPTSAAEQKIEGAVLLSFTINANGATENIKVLTAEPENIFNEEAKKALKQWKYSPSSNTTKKHIAQLNFLLSEDSQPINLVEGIKLVAQ